VLFDPHTATQADTLIALGHTLDQCILPREEFDRFSFYAKLVS
jgi:hypothetical protein